MARRLGEILVARGKLSGAQLQKALQAQMIWGGHLGTNLIELGFLTEDELGEVLAETHSVHYAPYDVLQEIPASVLAAIPRGLVEKYKIVPFRFDGKRLHLVMMTPQDLTALDEVSFATGFQLVPYVTPEIRLFQILEKYYNIPRAKRYITLSRELSLRATNRAKPEERAAERKMTGIDLPRPSPSIFDPAPARPAEAARVPKSPVSEESADDVGALFPVTEATDWTPRTYPHDPQTDEGVAPSSELVPEAVDAGTDEISNQKILDKLLHSRTLEEICSRLVEEAAGTLKRCAVFARSGENMIAVAGSSASTPSWPIEGLWLPFTVSAAEALFGDRRTYYIGPPPGGAEEALFYERIGSGPPPNAFLAPVRLSERIALVFYGDHIDEEIRPDEVGGILGLLQQAGLALDLLALRRKDSPS